MSDITVYGTSTCNDCRRSKRLLDDHQVAYRWVDIEPDPVATAMVLELNGGARVIPTIVFADGSFLAEPSDDELATKLGLLGSVRPPSVGSARHPSREIGVDAEDRFDDESRASPVSWDR